MYKIKTPKHKTIMTPDPREPTAKQGKTVKKGKPIQKPKKTGIVKPGAGFSLGPQNTLNL